MLESSFALVAILVALLGAIGTFNWHLSSGNSEIKKQLSGRVVLLEADLRERLTKLHGRFRERMFFISEGRNEAHSAEQLQQWEQFELEQWKRILDNEWDAISSRFHHLYQARHDSHTWCFVAWLLANLNIVSVLISATLLVMSIFSARWRPWVTLWLPRVCVVLMVSTCVVWGSMLVGKLRERRLEGITSGDK